MLISIAAEGSSAFDPGWLIALSALFFTVGSFWWIQVRRGRLTGFEPHSFAAVVSGSAVLLLRLPLAIHNTGAKPIIVQGLKLTFPDEPDAVIGLPWRNTRTQLRPDPDDYEDLPAVFSIAGRTVAQKYIEFGGPFPGIVLEAREYTVKVEAKLSHKKEWTALVKFPLRAQNITDPSVYIAHSNDPRYLSDDERAKAKAALQRLHEQLRPDAQPGSPG